MIQPLRWCTSQISSQRGSSIFTCEQDLTTKPNKWGASHLPLLLDPVMSLWSRASWDVCFLHPCTAPPPPKLYLYPSVSANAVILEMACWVALLRSINSTGRCDVQLGEQRRCHLLYWKHLFHSRDSRVNSTVIITITIIIFPQDVATSHLCFSSKKPVWHYIILWFLNDFFT